MATKAGDEQTVQFMLKRWQDPETGLDQAWREEYMVYLSFPDPKNPNKVTVGESTGCPLCRTDSGDGRTVLFLFRCVVTVSLKSQN